MESAGASISTNTASLLDGMVAGLLVALFHTSVQLFLRSSYFANRSGPLLLSDVATIVITVFVAETSIDIFEGSRLPQDSDALLTLCRSRSNLVRLVV